MPTRLPHDKRCLLLSSDYIVAFSTELGCEVACSEMFSLMLSFHVSVTSGNEIRCSIIVVSLADLPLLVGF